MKILLVSATTFEIAPFQAYLNETFASITLGRYWKGELEIVLLVTGIGLTLTSYALTKILSMEKFDLAIQAGVAGVFNTSYELGTVVQVVSERFADVGIEEANGHFTDMHELGLIAPNEVPFSEGVLWNKAAAAFDFLPKVKGLSVNKVHGFAPNIAAIENKYAAEVESMEGAAFFYVCLMENIPFLEIRAISNRVEPRNRDLWQMEIAIKNLNHTLKEMIASLG